MSNNIYNILGKLNALAPKEETPKTVEQKPVYESVAARGSVLEGIAKVESRLARMFAEEKANEDMLAKKDYDGDGKKESPKDEYMGSKDKAIKKSMGKKDLDEETHGQYLAQKEKEAEQSGKSSFQAFKQTHPVDGKPGVEEAEEEETEESLEEGFDDLQKYMADKAKGAKQGGGEGKKQGTRYGGGLQKDDEGDKEEATADTPKKKGRPKKDKFAESAESTGTMLAEGALDKIAHQYSKEVKDFMSNGDLDDDLFSALYDYYFDDMPYGTKKARDGDPYEWVAGRFHQDMKMRDLREADVQSESGSIWDKAKALGGKARDAITNLTDYGAEDMHRGNFEKWINKQTGLIQHKEELLQYFDDEIKSGTESDQAGRKALNQLKMKASQPAMEQPMIESGAFVPGRTVYWRGKEGEVDRVEGNKCFVHRPNGEMDVWPTREVSTEKESMLDTIKGGARDIGQGIKNFITNKPDPMDEELNELAKLAGLAEAKKCNNTMEGKSCPVHGLKECGSMTEAKKPDYLDFDKDGDKKEPMKKALKDKEKVDECGPGPMGSMDQDEGNMSINTSMNSDGTKSVSVNATGDQADALAQMLKMAGLAAHHAVHGGEEPKGIVIQAGPEEQVEEERDVQYANTPDEEVENVDAILHQGDDLHKEKEQYAGMAKLGDNPMATRESIEMPKSISRMLAGVKLASKQ